MKKLNNKGFTLVELLVSVTIMGIILAIAIPQLTNLQTSNKESKYIKYGESVVTSAKLYTDSYSKDMFGNNSSGCYDIPYSSLEAKNLVKDIKVDGSTCAVYDTDSVTSLTYVRVYKSNDNYLYDLQIVCHNKDGNIVYESTLTDDICDGTTTDTEGPTITISENNNWTTGKDASGNPLKATVTIADPYGLKENVEVEYGWTKTPDNISTVDFKEKKFTNARGKERELSFDVEYPQNENGYWYLVVRPINELRDANGNFYTGPYTKSSVFKLDNTSPEIDEVKNSSTGPTNGAVTIEATAIDSLSGIKKVYYTYSNSTENLHNISGTFEVGNTPVTVTKKWTSEINKTVYIVAEDVAGNKSAPKSAGKVEIDKTGPKCVSSGGSDDWTNKNVTIKGTCTDTDGSGCKGNVEKTYSEDINSTTESPGTVYDEAGNSTVCPANQTVKIDKTPPTTPTKGAIGSVSGSSTTGSIKTSASGSTDTGSGVKEYRYLVTNSSTTPTDKSKFKTSKDFTRSCGTSYYAWAVAVDYVGNISGIKSLGNTADGANKYSDYGECSKSCGGGTQTRTNTCALITTDLSQTCNSRDCCSSVTYKDGSSCSKTCGGGTYNRLAYSAYDGSRCSSKDESSGGSSCNTHDCCSSLTYKDGSSCSVSCGGGTYNRLAYSTYDGSRCSAYDTSTGGSSCNTRDCCSSTEISGYGNWGSCSVSCGGGTRYRDVYLVSAYDSSISCGTRSTQDSESCNTASCSCTHEYGDYITHKSDNYVNYYCTTVSSTTTWNNCNASSCSGSHTLTAGQTMCQLQCIHCGYRKTTKWCPNNYNLLP